MPAVPFDLAVYDESFPQYPSNDPSQLTGYVDASHAPDPTTRPSITGLGFSFAGSVVAYKSKMQLTMATSSTEAEFIACVTAAKTTKYLRSVLSDLGFPPCGPTILYVDKQAVIAMVNEDCPTRGLIILIFNISRFKNGIVVVCYVFITLPASSIPPIRVPNPWLPPFITLMHIISWVTTVDVFHLLSKCL
jgi:hypothetical protein